MTTETECQCVSFIVRVRPTNRQPSLFIEELQEPPPLSVYIHYYEFRDSEEVAIALNLY